MIVRLAVTAAALGLAASAAAAQTPSRAAGERIARTYCAECHAVGLHGRSPLADAPPFRQLSRRYPRGGGLNDLLAKGMIVSDESPQEEGGAPRHPRMPQARLDEAQIGELKAYLEWLQGRGDRRR